MTILDGSLPSFRSTLRMRTAFDPASANGADYQKMLRLWDAKIQRAKSSSAKCIGKMSTMDCGVRTATGKNLVGNITRTTVIAVNKLVANNHAALQRRNGERAVAVTSDADDL